MPSLKDIRIRIDSTKNTQAITKAMKMVSAAKLRRAQTNIVNMRPYANTITQVIADVAATERVDHPLLRPVENPKRALLVVLTSDRGLCGAFNTNINRYTEKFLKENKQKYEKIDCMFIGRKSADYFKRRGVEPVDTMLNLAKDVSFELASRVAERMMKSYRSGDGSQENSGGGANPVADSGSTNDAADAQPTGQYDEILLIYNEFKSAIQQSVVFERLLPIDVSKQSTLLSGKGGFPPDMIFEPSAEKIIDALVVKHFRAQMYRCMSESVAAEHGARMTAMENATKNAGEMIRILTLTYNKLRQEKITTELIEITSGAEALKG